MNIKELRKAAKMTRTAFAEYFGIPYKTVQNWEAEGGEKRNCPKYLVDLIEYKLKAEKKI